MVIWEINSFPQSTFYITESSAFRNRILYFRHDDWQTLCAPLMSRLLRDTFEEVPQVRFVFVTAAEPVVNPPFEKRDAEETLSQRDLGYSFVRLLPKDTGVRPVVNLRGSRNPSVVSIFLSANGASL